MNVQHMLMFSETIFSKLCQVLVYINYRYFWIPILWLKKYPRIYIHLYSFIYTIQRFPKRTD